MKTTAWWTLPTSTWTSSVSESCGKCSPCRIGTKRLYEMLTQITNGQGTEQTLKDMKRTRFRHQTWLALRLRPDGC
jgi:NADH:ubiquinone oxidoreductase subunit F (NADH-binding)